MAYIITESSPGCLPENEPAVVHDADDALNVVGDIVSDARHNGWKAVTDIRGLRAWMREPGEMFTAARLTNEAGAERIVTVAYEPTVTVRMTVSQAENLVNTIKFAAHGAPVYGARELLELIEDALVK